MKITIQTDETQTEIAVDIRCPGLTPELEKVISLLRTLDMKLTGQKERSTYILDVSQVLYIDSADKKTFLYTENEVYESDLRLYELEEQLARADFIRAGKSSIVNLRRIMSLRSEIDGRIRVTMSNGEKLVVSRQYAGILKQRLGVK
ncbi:LytTR family DNA-binding domain-containing protein [Lachnotalea sp. AF33-28]|jgi:DNA-binding LytR/AlgR family response regulator|uniref:LytTR family DNA-binding domain-containing protein n=1 Tax=Lachnotalea sp. AF33-28 TaxID=2292046 RepID=UPI000E5332C8|nr:LytTR family DNA-binding domain-containing protein [Lachnotalea sp. AF33-28]RHP35524.1 LytTR family transcriptional regulator [Lachnotalea sp. AF33-28]